jgi:drug/metabolite transporter (DMT)-like permease
VAVLVGGGAAVKTGDWWLAVGAGLLAPLSYGVAGTYAKRAAALVSPFDNAHGSMWAATLIVLPLLWVVPVRAVPGPGDWTAVTALGVVCTGAAFLVYFRLIRDVGPVRALSVTFLIPVFGVLWGAVFLHEPVGWNTVIGGAVVLLGTGLTNGVIRWPRKAVVAGA